jgi:Uma2 family endonuclease
MMATETLGRTVLKDNSSAVPDVPLMTFEEYLEWPHENQHVEWVNGKVVPMSPVSAEHQDIVGFLLILISHFVRARRLGRVLFDPFQMKSAPNLPVRAPDILFVANENLHRLKKNHLDGPADLVVEIISPGSGATDRGDKFYEYEAGGVPEYWLIDPQRKQAEFYERGEDGIYHPALVGEDGIYHSRVLNGLWLQVNWLWRKPLPDLLDVLRQWKLI